MDGKGSCFYLSLRDYLGLTQYTAKDLRQKQINYMLANSDAMVVYSLNGVPLCMELRYLVEKECRMSLEDYCKKVLHGSDGKVHEAGDVDIAINCK